MLERVAATHNSIVSLYQVWCILMLEHFKNTANIVFFFSMYVMHGKHSKVKGICLLMLEQTHPNIVLCSMLKVYCILIIEQTQQTLSFKCVRLSFNVRANTANIVL